MLPDQECAKKDKRLLVLLALGALMLAGNIADSASSYRGIVREHSWLELRKDGNSLYRMDPGKGGQDVLNGLDSIPARLREPLLSTLRQQGMAALETDSSGNVHLKEPSPRLAFFLGHPFSINTAGEEELMLVPGIGPAMAGKILAYRHAHGPITDGRRLEDIRGIGTKTRQRLQDYFTYSADSE